MKQHKVWKFIKQIFVSAKILFSSNVLYINPLKCVSINNQWFIIRPLIVHNNSSNPSFYRYSFKISSCRGSCDSINDSYTKCVPNYAFLILLKEEILKYSI